VQYRGLIPTAFLNDHQIRPTDFRNWADARLDFERRPKDRKKVDELKASISVHGLREPILLCVHERYPDVYVSDGHHREVAFMELGIELFPFRWHWIRGGVHVESDPFPYDLLGVTADLQPIPN
jgi:hypothetical protein